MKPTHILSIYKARDGYRWRLVARNGRLIADSGEAYSRKADAKRAVWRLHEAVMNARVVA